MAMEALPLRSNDGLSPLLYPYHSTKHTQLIASLLQQNATARGKATQSILRDELSSQVYVAPPRFVLVTTAGVLEIEKLRPIDILRQILDLGPLMGASQAPPPPPHSLHPVPPAPSVQEQAHKLLRAFFEAYGANEAACMAVMIAASAPGVGGASSVSPERDKTIPLPPLSHPSLVFLICLTKSCRDINQSIPLLSTCPHFLSR